MSRTDKLRQLIQKGNNLLKTYQAPLAGTIGFPTLDTGDFSAWRAQCLQSLQPLLPSMSAYVKQFDEDVIMGFPSHVEGGIKILECVIEDLDNGVLDIPAERDPISLVTNLCERFHHVARQLRSRHQDRPTLDVQDEYDVQYLFHALLYIHFSDVRAEEWTPSYAGKSSRMDFLLKQESIVIEIKKARQGLDAKILGSQLIDDVARYKEHPNCATLFCFVYDPEGRISNPRGIENDLRRQDGDISVEVLIKP